jgi:hypothetical protein
VVIPDDGGAVPTENHAKRKPRSFSPQTITQKTASSLILQISYMKLFEQVNTNRGLFSAVFIFLAHLTKQHILFCLV